MNTTTPPHHPPPPPPNHPLFCLFTKKGPTTIRCCHLFPFHLCLPSGTNCFLLSPPHVFLFQTSAATHTCFPKFMPHTHAVAVRTLPHSFPFGPAHPQPFFPPPPHTFRHTTIAPPPIRSPRMHIVPRTPLRTHQAQLTPPKHFIDVRGLYGEFTDSKPTLMAALTFIDYFFTLWSPAGTAPLSFFFFSQVSLPRNPHFSPFLFILTSSFLR